MQIFTMNGMQITGPGRFQTCFCPTDFLRQRELAAGFAEAQLQLLSPAASFHSQMLYRAVFDWDSGIFGDISSPEFYARQDILGVLDPKDKAFRKLTLQLWRLCQKTQLDPDRQAKLFCILLSGYSLAVRELSDVPLTPETAEAAYRRCPAAARKSDFYHPIAPEGDIVLSAREAPYRFLLDTEKALSLLAEGAGIRPRKLILQEHWQGGSGLSVTVELHSPNRDPEILSLQPGDYRMMNFVGDIPVWLHPASVSVGDYTLLREKDSISLLRSGTELERISCAGREILSLALESAAPGIRPGFILADTDLVDYSRYTDLDTHRPWLRRRGIVEVALRDRLYYLLHHSGTLYTNRQGCTGQKLSCLADFFAQGGTHHDQ